MAGLRSIKIWPLKIQCSSVFFILHLCLDTYQMQQRRFLHGASAIHAWPAPHLVGQTHTYGSTPPQGAHQWRAWVCNCALFLLSWSIILRTVPASASIWPNQSTPSGAKKTAMSFCSALKSASIMQALKEQNWGKYHSWAPSACI